MDKWRPKRGKAVTAIPRGRMKDEKKTYCLIFQSHHRRLSSVSDIPHRRPDWISEGCHQLDYGLGRDHRQRKSRPVGGEKRSADWVALYSFRMARKAHLVKGMSALWDDVRLFTWKTKGERERFQTDWTFRFVRVEIVRAHGRS
jgi:hypothetical protein